jgi:hypothetical protein
MEIIRDVINMDSEENIYNLTNFPGSLYKYEYITSISIFIYY